MLPESAALLRVTIIFRSAEPVAGEVREYVPGRDSLTLARLLDNPQEWESLVVLSLVEGQPIRNALRLWWNWYAMRHALYVLKDEAGAPYTLGALCERCPNGEFYLPPVRLA